MGVPDSQVHQSGEPGPSPATQSSRKRKADASGSGSASKVATGKEVVDLTADTPPKKRTKRDPNEEKRLRVFRKKAPQSYQAIRERALSQRMFVLDRERTATPDHPVETVSLAGTTGNVYSITIDKVPSCNCPHALKGNQCKHIVYVLARVLRVSADLEYQLAFVSAELRDIFDKAPPLPSEQGEQSEKDGNRKPIEGECPICCEDFVPAGSGEQTVYCKASCGNNMHKECFSNWAATKAAGKVTCPFCRSPWAADETSAKHLKNVAEKGTVNADGYVNVASQLGISQQRDYSTYNQYWLERQFGREY